MFMRPIPPQIGYVQCTIERNNSGINRICPLYYLKLSEGNKYIMTGDKMANSTTSNYKITVGQSKSDNTENYIGKIRSNFKNTHFYIYGEGINRNEAKKNPSKQIRRQYGSIIYTDSMEIMS